MTDQTSPREAILKAASAEKSVTTDDDPIQDPDPRVPLSDHKLKHEIDALKQELQEAKDTHTLRLKYAGNIFWLICGWLIFVAVILLLSGFKCRGFELSEKVLITFLTTTTINVIGLFLVVTKWLYPNTQSIKNNSPLSKKDKK